MTGNEYPKMRVWSHHRWEFPLPAGHKFPLGKYELLAERVVDDGLVAPGDVLEPEPCTWDDLAAVHDCGLLSRIREGCLTAREARGLGLPGRRPSSSAAGARSAARSRPPSRRSRPASR